MEVKIMILSRIRSLTNDTKQIIFHFPAFLTKQGAFGWKANGWGARVSQLAQPGETGW